MKDKQQQAAEDEIRRHMEALAKRNEGVQKAKEEKEAHAAMMFKKIAEEAERQRLEKERYRQFATSIYMDIHNVVYVHAELEPRPLSRQNAS